MNYIYKKLGNPLTITIENFMALTTLFFSNQGDVKVEKGDLSIEWRNMKGAVFTKTFEQDERGKFSFKTNGCLHSIRVEGVQTKGSCQFELVEK